MRFQTLSEGRWIFFGVAVLGAVGLFFNQHWLVFIAALLFLFCVNFFRDPERPVPPGDDVVVAAADGVVSEIIEIEENEVLKTRCRRVGIFLSVVDVHVNKAPIAGKIIYRQHHKGLFLDARDPACSEKNEALTWAFEGVKATLVVRLLTGAIARRIVPWSQVGDTVPKGFRFGMIRFGSRTEVYLPLSAEVTVKVGDKVKGAETIIAKLI
jgi:phosphatidylserine decarboxylase